jgi:hypothetical protein
MDSAKTTNPASGIEDHARAVIEQVMAGKPVDPQAARTFGRFRQASWRHGDAHDYS